MHPDHNRRRWITIVGVLATAWLAALVLGYYVVHKPFGAAFALGLGRVLGDLLLAAAILTAAGGLGRWLAPGSAHHDRLTAAAVQAALGLGVLCIALLLAGMLGLLSPWLAWALLAGALALLRRHAWGWLAAWWGDGWATRVTSRFSVLVGVLCSVLLAAALVEASAPPIHFDALVYHLALPNQFASAGSIRLTPDNPFWGMPLGAEMLYTWGLLLGRSQTATVLGWMIGVVAVGGTIGLARRFGREAGWVGAGALLAGETAAATLGWGYAETLAMLEGLALVAVLESFRRERSLRGAALAGALAAFAIGAKYTAGAALIAAAVVLVALNGLTRAWKPLGVFVGVAACGTAPWLFKNLVYAGAALFPFAGQSPWSPALRQALYAEVGVGISPLSAVLTPLLATFRGAEGAPGYAASLGPLLLGLVPGVIVVRRSAAASARLVALFTSVGWGVWIIAGLFSAKLIQARLYFVLLPSWATLAAAGYAGLSRLRLRGVRFRFIAATLVAIPLAMTSLGALRGEAEAAPLAAALGTEPAEAYVTRRLGAFGIAMQSVQDLGPSASVLMLWEPRSLYCLPTCRPDPWLDRWLLARAGERTADQILAQWRSDGVTHVLLYRAGVDFVRVQDARYTQDDWAELERLTARMHLVSRVGDAYELYQVTP